MIAAGQNLKRLVKKKRQDFLGNTPENAHPRSARFLFVGEQIMKKLAGFLCVEYFPYHSRRFKKPVQNLPSQQYGFHLVHRAIDRGAIIILMRSKRLWLEAVSQLHGYSRLFELRNPQNPAISPRNCPQGYPLIAEILLRG
jgi:hypothetical protein